MAPKAAPQLGAREREIMDIVHRLGSASVADVRKRLAEPPTYSAVRGMLGLLEDKGLLHHRDDGVRYLYAPTMSRGAAQRSALRHLVGTFFGGSAAEAAAMLLEMSDASLSSVQAERLAAMIRAAQRDGR